jgi:hypothetical protein
MKNPTEFDAELKREMTKQNDHTAYFDGDHSIEEKIPESQGDLADRAGDEIESDLQWRIEMIRRASREDYSKRMQSKH